MILLQRKSKKDFMKVLRQIIKRKTNIREIRMKQLSKQFKKRKSIKTSKNLTKKRNR
jgi:hypothetical protein